MGCFNHNQPTGFLEVRPPNMSHATSLPSGKDRTPVALETVVPRDGSRDDLKVLPTEAEGLRPGDPVVGKIDGYKVGPLRSL